MPSKFSNPICAVGDSIFCAVFSPPKSMFNILTFVLWVQIGAMQAKQVIVTSKICYKIDVQYKLKICRELTFTWSGFGYI